MGDQDSGEAIQAGLEAATQEVAPETPASAPEAEVTPETPPAEGASAEAAPTEAAADDGRLDNLFRKIREHSGDAEVLQSIEGEVQRFYRKSQQEPQDTLTSYAEQVAKQYGDEGEQLLAELGPRGLLQAHYRVQGAPEPADDDLSDEQVLQRRVDTAVKKAISPFIEERQREQSQARFEGDLQKEMGGVTGLSENAKAFLRQDIVDAMPTLMSTMPNADLTEVVDVRRTRLETLIAAERKAERESLLAQSKPGAPKAPAGTPPPAPKLDGTKSTNKILGSAVEQFFRETSEEEL